MEKKIIHYKKINDILNIEIDKDIAKKYIKIKKEIIKLEKELEPIEIKLKADTESILTSLDEKKFASNGLLVSYKEGYIQNKFDTTRFKSEKPTLYKKYVKEVPTKGSVKIEVL